MIVILTALSREYKAIRKHMTGLRTHQHQAGTVFEVGTLAGRHVALAVMGPGNASAAVITERAIAEFQPDTVMFVGIAGGLRNWLTLGDVVVATRVYGYHGGRSEDDAFRSRPRAWDASHALEQLAQLVERKDTWHDTIPGTPAVHFGPIAAGEVVLDSAKSETAQHIRNNYNDAIAIEMESAGVALASHLNEQTASITIRGISDHADGAKETTDATNAPQLAADNAAAFAAALIAELDDTRPHQHQAKKEPTVTNIASGNANVVTQIGTVKGNITFGQPRPGGS